MRIFKCNRCKKRFADEEQYCWFCKGILCFECWDEFGHCGHSDADRMNQLIAEFNEKEARERKKRR